VPRRSAHRQPKRSENGGFGSGIERTNYKKLEEAGVTFEYESDACKFYYIKPTHKGKCADCGSENVGSDHVYTADFYIKTKSGKEIWVEIKGGGYSWTGETRAKHVLLSKQFPNREVRFVFCNEYALIGKGAKTTNKAWCKRHGFICTSKLIPKSWCEE